METLNKSLYTSCAHIFQPLAQKILRVRSVFLRFFELTDKKSDSTIYANDLISVPIVIIKGAVIPQPHKNQN